PSVGRIRRALTLICASFVAAAISIASALIISGGSRLPLSREASALAEAPTPTPDPQRDAGVVDPPESGHSRSGLPEVLLSRQLLEESGVHVGDEVTFALDAQGSRATQFKVVGRYEPTPNPMKFSARRLEARLHLPDVLAL